MNENVKYYLGVDIGGTKISVTLGTEKGEILEKEKFPTPPTPEDSLSQIVSTLKCFSDKYPHCKMAAIGVSCGGPLDNKKGLILSPPNLPGWDSIAVCQILEKETGIPAYLENDANACALAEWIWGSGKGSENMIFLTFGTGLGAGLILNGKLYSGTSGQAGEVGHIRMAEDGPIAYGKKGSWESFCSGNGISQLNSLHNGEDLTTEQICQRADKGEEKYLKIIKESANQLGRGLALLVDLLNPEKIIIGSVFTRAEHLFRQEMEAQLKEESLPLSLADVSIEVSSLGESLGDKAALSIAINGEQNVK